MSSYAELEETDDDWASNAREQLPAHADAWLAGDALSTESHLALLWWIVDDRPIVLRQWVDQWGRDWRHSDNRPMCLCAEPGPGCCAGG